MHQIESNDECFTGIWSNAQHLECGILFLNSELSDDVFFNKLAHVTCLNENMIDYSLVQFQKNHSNTFVYSLNYPEFENLLKRKGFTYYDTQYVLKKTAVSSKNLHAIKISYDDVSIWTKIFCNAYDCPEWFESVNSIVKNSLHAVDYFVDESMSSCVALYEKNSILGLYCLGTMVNRRKEGTASYLINYALNEVHSRNLDFLMLETFERDDLLQFYTKLGFEILYFKKIYTI